MFIIKNLEKSIWIRIWRRICKEDDIIIIVEFHLECQSIKVSFSFFYTWRVLIVWLLAFSFLITSVNPSQSFNTVYSINIIKKFIIILFIIKINWPRNSPSTSLNICLPIADFLTYVLPSLNSCQFRLLCMLLRFHHYFHSRSIQWKRLCKVSDVECVFLIFECIFNFEIKPLLMALSICVYIQVQVIICGCHIFSFLKIPTFKERIE